MATKAHDAFDRVRSVVSISMLNRRERAVLILVTAAFVAGVGVSLYRRVELKHRAALNPVVVVRDTGMVPDADAGQQPLDLNRATARQLDGLPGIGPVLAGRIIEYRQRRGGFRSVSELRAVPGIGEKRYSTLRKVVEVGPPDAGGDSSR